jgi:exodeoxyribonuclease X
MQPILVKKMPFGKHKGTPLEKLPGSYTKWLLGLDNLDEDMRYSLNRIYG